MLSGSINNTFKDTWRLIAEWSATQNIEENYSLVTVNFYLTGDYAIYASSRNNGYITIDGSRYNFTANSSISAGQKKLLGSATKKVYHNNVGEKTFKIYASYDLKVTLSGTYIDTRHVEGNFRLNDIPRASTMSGVPESFDIDTAFGVGVQRADASFTHKVTMYLGTKYIGEWTGGPSISVSLDTTRQNRIYEEIPDATKATVTLKLTTYKGTKQIGDRTETTIVAKVPSDIKPYFSSIGHREDAPVVINSEIDLYIKTLSKIRIWFRDAVANKYATIKSYAIHINDKNYLGSAITTDLINKSGTLTITATLTDSRNRTFTRTLDITVANYAPPDIQKVVPKRYLNSSGTEDGMGTYLGVDILGQVSSLKVGTIEKNTCTIRIYKKPKGYPTWSAIYNNTWSLSIMSTWGYYPGYLIDAAYDIRIEVEDKFNIVRVDRILPTAIITGELAKTGMSIGTTYREGEGVLQLASPYGQNDEFPLINMSGGYVIYRDNTSLAGAISRAWLDTPDMGEVVIGPRSSSRTMKQFRVRAEKHSFEDGPIFNGSYNKNGNGYTKLPNDFIMVWGEVVYSASGNTGYIRVTLPMTLPNNIYNVVATPKYQSGAPLDVTITAQPTRSEIIFYVRSSGSKPTSDFRICYQVWGD
ncbi:DUF859 family phage minor structural protein [Senegalia massiliensis]|uniref:DUF859 family phage minor structural protein n=1 Tax=Senegalia massiliensis TaxID=1720316 RepID=UPI0010303ABC|nr:DUF859 family phage minor structural protein [Senegalia massiliensis]